MGLETLAIIGIGASLAGTGLSAYNQYEQGKSNQALNNYNAALGDQSAATIQRDAAIVANSERARNQKIQAKQRAAFAANGIVGDTGSPLLVEAQTAANLELGALETQRQGNIQASNQSQQAELDRMAGKSARRAGNVGAAATILQGVGNAGVSWANYKGIS